MIGTQILIVSELLIEALDVHSTERVLDVATGSGNAALAAARRGCAVVGLDYVPALLERARRRAEAEASRPSSWKGTPRRCRSRMPASTSSAQSSGRCSRRTRNRPRASSRASAGQAAGSAWSRIHPRASSASSSKRTRSTCRRPPGFARRSNGARRERLRELSGDAIAEIRLEKRLCVFRYRSPEAYVDNWRRYYGPTMKAFEAVGEAGRGALETDLADLIARFLIGRPTARWSCQASTSRRSSSGASTFARRTPEREVLLPGRFRFQRR
jgi:hypothetical protein